MTTVASTSPSFLTPDAIKRAGDDPIFFLNAEANRRKAAGEPVINATLGALLQDDGTLAVMPSIVEAFRSVDAKASAAYAPIAGDAPYLKAVIGDLFGTSPLAAQATAVATPGGSGALHLALTSFLEAGQSVLVPHFYWGPYLTMATHTRRHIATFAMFDARGNLDLAAFERGLDETLTRQGRALVIFNFPCNNPTGYSLNEAEWAETTNILERAARRGPVAFLIDHAYARFGGAAADAWIPHAQRLVGKVLVLVAWTASKSFAQYGARVGALVALHPDADERKRIQGALSFSCRGTWSNCNHLGLLAIASVLNDPERRRVADAERAQLVKVLDERVATFNREAKAAGIAYPRYEGGFFVSVFAANAEATAARMREDAVFVVPMDGAVRIALCSTPAKDVPRLVASLKRALA
ncbi:MAG: aminotransferase class I/II-fold pyridoxal phosphate-dependent enzyme [Planctomycetes bacterium]|nr:aminotransferase class I/II-fold pyridoxal phosphate-dependent enzyme [Planctomycetota bacterium]